ncbi:hypothetical protein EWB00_011146 [Schistosoma japonicum]|uniref:Uncharacterized protein n=1 Tax=Schistosoma japonicum TaxID=6182 RepID=A0A4Z2DLJ6_SCHJA|nr:hypothetical protein EWB00_011146 [Schistosoma japonicum]
MYVSSLLELLPQIFGVNSTFENGRTMQPTLTRKKYEAKLTLAPDDSPYTECATYEDVKSILRNYVAV